MQTEENRLNGLEAKVNPYQASQSDAAWELPRGVAVFGFLALVLLLLAIYVAAPGVVLLND